MTVTGPGLFILTIVDSMKRRRIELMIAVAPAQDSGVIKSFQEAHALMKEWREDFFGWPMHEFQRAYLQSLMLDIKPEQGGEREVTSTVPPATDVTAEPTFTPRPGVVGSNTAVTFQCATPGAVIHYSIGALRSH